MTHEFSILRDNGILARSVHSISFEVICWLFFKTHLLEKKENREYFSAFSPSLNSKDFLQHLQKRVNLKKYAPARARASPSDIRSTKGRMCRELVRMCYEWYQELLSPESNYYASETSFGLGLFARREICVPENVSLPNLTGTSAWISSDEALLLSEKRYPSLFDHPSEGHSICSGPLSLMNHDCRSTLKLHTSKKTGDTTLRVRSVMSKRRRFMKGHEILLNYGKRYFGAKKSKQKCQCRSCV